MIYFYLVTFMIGIIMVIIIKDLIHIYENNEKEVQENFTHKYKDLKPGDVFKFRKDEDSSSFFEIVYEIGNDETSEFWEVFGKKPYIGVFTPICAEDGPGYNNMDMERGCDIIDDKEDIKLSYDRSIKELEKMKISIEKYLEFLKTNKNRILNLGDYENIKEKNRKYKI